MMKTPRATYRLQLTPEFGFAAAAEIAAYLAELGISHVYCSPYLQAAPGSTHGYDVVDYHRVNVELGGDEGRAAFCEELGKHTLGQVLDIVPNHMATGEQNPWWWDTLENGPLSRYAPYFDIEWNAPEERLRNKILLPVLGDHIGRVIAASEICLERRGGSFVIRYFEHVFPAAPESVSDVLAEAAAGCGNAELGFLADALARLSRPGEADWEGLYAHHRNKEAIRDLLDRLFREQPEAAARADEVVREVNSDPDRLDSLLSHQNYRLSRWQSAARELVYRRFFDINTLVGVRVEEERVFADTHLLVLQWLRKGELDGVRVDHPDGLRDPSQYFRRLRSAAPDAWIVAEKILQPGEALPDSWDIAGTTGYEFLNLCGGLFIDQRGEAPLNELYREFTGEPLDFQAIAREKKVVALRDLLGSDLGRLTSLFVQICEQHRDQRDYTRHEVHEAIRTVIACFPVYRTYVQPNQEVTRACLESLTAAVEAAKRERPDLDPRLFDFLLDVLTLRESETIETEFTGRFQQTSAAVVAKGVEDTAFYSYLRLVSLNEVGGDPGRFGVTIDAFHEWCKQTQARRPFMMLASSTHDTKRSEDVRARISILSEVPSAWVEAVKRWSASNARYRSGEWPDRKTEYLLYQSMAGAWPISKERMWRYMQKAIREAKERTSWTAPNEAYEKAVESFIDGLYSDAEYLRALEEFLAPLIAPARWNSLAMTVLKFTAPGVPDIYQGTELWDLSLVDPDNRRPVDYPLRRRLLAELDSLTVEQILQRSEEGLPKLWTTRQCLRTRVCRAASFGDRGSYRPLWAAGPKAAHIVAFERGEDVITVAPRLRMSIDDWGDTMLEIPEGRWTNQFTGDTVEGGKLHAGALLRRFPIALLAKEAA